MHAVELGNKEAPLLVFLHGGGVGGWMWNEQAKYFKHYHVLIPTLQGHGRRSEETVFSIRGNAEEILTLIREKRDGKDVHIVGFSIGAQICLEMLSLAPHLFQSAMINSAVVIPMKYMIPIIAPVIKMTSPLIRNKRFAKAQAKQLYMDGNYFRRYYEDSQKMKPSTLIDVLKENMAYSLPEGFSESTARILVTGGDKEKGLVKRSVQRIVEGNGRCESFLVKDMGHGFPVAKPDLFNQVLEDWIEKPIQVEENGGKAVGKMESVKQ